MDKKSFNSFWSSKKVSERRRDKTILFYSMDKSYKVRDIEKGLKNCFFLADIESGPMSSYILKEHHIGWTVSGILCYKTTNTQTVFLLISYKALKYNIHKNPWNIFCKMHKPIDASELRGTRLFRRFRKFKITLHSLPK